MSDDTEKLDAFNRLCGMPDALFAALGYRVTKVQKCCDDGCELCGWYGYVRVFDSGKAAVEAAEKGVRE